MASSAAVDFCDVLLSAESMAQANKTLEEHVLGTPFTLRWRASGLTAKARARLYVYDGDQSDNVIAVPVMGESESLWVRFKQIESKPRLDRPSAGFRADQLIALRRVDLTRRDLTRSHAELSELFAIGPEDVRNLHHIRLGYRQRTFSDVEESYAARYAVVWSELGRFRLQVGLEIDCADAAEFTRDPVTVRVAGEEVRCLVPVAEFTRSTD